MNDKQRRERVLLYLYGELSPAEEEAFRAEVDGDGRLAQLLEQEERFQRLYPAGASLKRADEMLAEGWQQVHQALRREARRGPSLQARLRTWWEALLPVARLAGAGALVLVGVLAGRYWPEGGEGPQAVIDLQVQRFDERSGEVELVYGAVHRQEVHGRLGDERVQRVLAAALEGDVEAGPRLQAVALLHRQTARVEIRQVLVQALLEDGNAGVRFKAAEALSGRAADPQVRRALSRALMEDENPGVRMAALEALKDSRDPEVVEVLERKREVDENLFIRAEAGRLLEGMGAGERL